MTRWLGRLAGLLLAAAICGILFMGAVYADTLSSANYRFDESSLGNGGLVQSSSANYQSIEAIGDTAVGNTKSTNFQVESGSKTTPDPALAFGVTNPTANFGNFSPNTTATATATFTVSDYTSFGYAVQLVGDPPTNGTHTIASMGGDPGGPASPQTGIEQFGVNLAANTIPSSFGAAPDQGQFGAGEATNNYKTANVYRYVNGETIAMAPKSSGVTIFTISYIVNVNSLTPGGAYTSAQSVVCTGTF